MNYISNNCFFDFYTIFNSEKIIEKFHKQENTNSYKDLKGIVKNLESSEKISIKQFKEKFKNIVPITFISAGLALSLFYYPNIFFEIAKLGVIFFLTSPKLFYISTFCFIWTLLDLSPSFKEACINLLKVTLSLTFSKLQTFAKKSAEVIVKPVAFLSPMFWSLIAAGIPCLLISQLKQVNLIATPPSDKGKNILNTKNQENNSNKIFSFNHLLSDRSKEILTIIIQNKSKKETLELIKEINRLFDSIKNKAQSINIDLENSKDQIENLMESLLLINSRTIIFKLQITAKNIEKINSPEKFFEKIVSWILRLQSNL